MSNQDKPAPEQKPAPIKLPYTPPRLNRWGTLEDLTLGGGGKRAEPGTGKKATRF